MAFCRLHLIDGFPLVCRRDSRRGDSAAFLGLAKMVLFDRLLSRYGGGLKECGLDLQLQQVGQINV